MTIRFLDEGETNGLSNTGISMCMNHADADTLNDLSHMAGISRTKLVRELFRYGLPGVLEAYGLDNAEMAGRDSERSADSLVKTKEKK